MPYSKVAIADASLSKEELMITPPPARRTKSMDDLLDDAGGFGAAQALTTAFAFACFVVHGAQVMSMAFVAPAAATLDFAGSPTQMKLTGSFFFAGWLLGLFLWGRVAARRGWLAALFFVEAGVAVAGCATAAAPTARSFLLARFLCGVAEGGVPTTSFGWAGEFLLPRHKTRVGIVLQMGFQLGSLLFTVSFSALGAAEWRLLSAGVSLCAVPLAVVAALLPESPRWLLRAGRAKDSANVVRTLARMNSRGDLAAGEGSDLDSPTGKGAAGAGAAAGKDKPGLVALVLADRALRRVMLVLGFHWLVYAALFFGISLREASDLAATTRMVALQIPALALTAVAFDAVGRRATMLTLLAGAAVSCAANSAASAGLVTASATAIASFTALGSVCMGAAFAGGYILSAEVLPTDVRALGLSACSQCARVGGFVSPLLLLIDESSATVPYAIWAALALAAGVATLALPETLGEPSIESVAELRQLMARQLGAGLAP